MTAVAVRTPKTLETGRAPHGTYSLANIKLFVNLLGIETTGELSRQARRAYEVAYINDWFDELGLEWDRGPHK